MHYQDWNTGMKKMLPVLLSYIPLGLAGGMVLSEAGFSATSIALMSTLVFGGAAQFMAASMVVAGASVVSIVFMTFFLNLRHLLLSSSISTYLKGKKRPFLLLFSHTLADEAYAVNYTEFSGNPDWSPEKAIGASVSGYLVWILSTTVGGLIGPMIPINTVLVNYVLIAMFICMMAMQWLTKIHVIVSMVTGATAVFLMALLKHNISLVIATVIGSTIGLMLEKRKDIRTEASLKRGEGQ